MFLGAYLVEESESEDHPVLVSIVNDLYNMPKDNEAAFLCAVFFMVRSYLQCGFILLRQ